MRPGVFVHVCLFWCLLRCPGQGHCLCQRLFVCNYVERETKRTVLCFQICEYCVLNVMAQRASLVPGLSATVC